MTSIETREQRLREVAHQIWEEEGRPEGEDARHWELAKEIVRKESGDDENDASGEEPPRGAVGRQ